MFSTPSRSYAHGWWRACWRLRLPLGTRAGHVSGTVCVTTPATPGQPGVTLKSNRAAGTVLPDAAESAGSVFSYSVTMPESSGLK